MAIAQRLYTGVELGDEGAVGLITYMRTDSPRISPEMTAAARDYLAATYGAQYVPERPNTYRSSKSAQEAHEAIRPTSLDNTPERVAPFLKREELSLYTLIWNRFVGWMPNNSPHRWAAWSKSLTKIATCFNWRVRGCF